MIETLLANPAIQGGIMPFVVAGILLLVGRPLGARAAGVAVLVAFLLAALFAIGFTFTPMTSTRRLVVLAALALPVGLLADVFKRGNIVTAVLTATGFLAAGWLLNPVLARKELLDAIVMGAGCGLYVAWLIAALDALRARSGASAGGTTALAFGTGLSALLGASAVLGQLGLALGSACAAAALTALFGALRGAGRTLTFPVAIAAGLVGCAGVVFAKLPWFVLPCLALVPVCASVVRPGFIPERLDVVWSGVLGLVPAAAAVSLTWWVAGGVPM